MIEKTMPTVCRRYCASCSEVIRRQVRAFHKRSRRNQAGRVRQSGFNKVDLPDPDASQQRDINFAPPSRQALRHPRRGSASAPACNAAPLRQSLRIQIQCRLSPQFQNLSKGFYSHVTTQALNSVPPCQPFTLGQKTRPHPCPSKPVDRDFSDSGPEVTL